MWVTIGPYRVSTWEWGLGNFEGMYNCEISLMSICVGKCFLFVFFKKLQKDNWCLFNLKILPNKLLPDVSGIKISATSEMWSFLVRLRKMDQNRPTNLSKFGPIIWFVFRKYSIQTNLPLHPRPLGCRPLKMAPGKWKVFLCIYMCICVFEDGSWMVDSGLWTVESW